MIINTHSHIYDEAFDADREEVFKRALEAGVEMLLLPRGPNAVVGCSHPDLWLGLGDSTMGPKFVYLL